MIRSLVVLTSLCACVLVLVLSLVLVLIFHMLGRGTLSCGYVRIDGHVPKHRCRDADPDLVGGYVIFPCNSVIGLQLAKGCVGLEQARPRQDKTQTGDSNKKRAVMQCMCLS